MEKLNKVFKSCIRTIHNKKILEGSSLDNFDWVNHNSDFLYEYAKSKKNLHTRKNYLLAIGKLLKIINYEQSRFYEEAFNTKKKIEEQEKDQRLSDHRLNTFVDWESIIKKRHQLKRKYEKDKRNYNANMRHLILCLYTMIPPIRNDYYNVEILENVDESDKDNNYLIMIDGQYNFHLNKDKMSYLKGPKKIIFPKKLTEIIEDSIYHCERDYLLCNIYGDPLTKKNVSSILAELFFNKTLTIVNIRSAKINHFYSKNKTIRQKEILAECMRHSAATALRSYNKILKNDKLRVKRLKRLKMKDTLIIPRNRDNTTLVLD